MLLPYLQFQTFVSMKGTHFVAFFSFPKVGPLIYNQISQFPFNHIKNMFAAEFISLLAQIENTGEFQNIFEESIEKQYSLSFFFNYH